MTEVAEKEKTEPYLAGFVADEAELPGAGLAWLRDARRAAIASFGELGFPTTQHEDWRATSVAPIAEATFRAVRPGEAGRVRASELDEFTYGAAELCRLVFVDGHYAPALSLTDPLPAGVRVGTLAALLAREPRTLEPHLGRLADIRSHAFAALNTACFRDGAFVQVAPGVVLDRPIHLLYVSTTRPEAAVSYPRALLLTGRGVQASFLESFVGVGGGAYFTNAVSELVVGENAQVEHTKIQRESMTAFHVATLQVRQEANSNFLSHSVALGGALVRNDLNTVLEGEGIETWLTGVYRVLGEQHLDNHTSIDHAKPHGMSRELYKGILEGKSKAVFNGKIIVRKNAQQTDAHQTNKNLLLCDDAIIDTKPQLEIFANDVKCKHGATIGHVSEEGVFYLRSRGVPEADARRVLIHAFLLEMVERMKVRAVRERMAALLFGLLGGDPKDAILWGLGAGGR